jgi:hypothetical protein
MKPSRLSAPGALPANPLPRLNYQETAHEHGENTRAAGEARDAYDAAFSRLVPGDDEQAGDLVDSHASIAASLCGYLPLGRPGRSPALRLGEARRAGCRI